MKLAYCNMKDGVLIVTASHDSDQNVPAAMYGKDTVIIPYADDHKFDRLGDPPIPGEKGMVVDHRPRIAPQVKGKDTLQYAANKRWMVLNGGVMVNKLRMPTDVDSRNAYATNAMRAKTTPNFTVQWKLPDGSFKSMTADELISLDLIVSQFTEACFNAEKKAVDLINSKSDVTSWQVDDFFKDLGQ